jgi:hypothetical protein
MHMAASTRALVIVSSLVAGVLGLAPGLALAQSNPAPAASDMVARCDLPVLDVFNPNPGDLVLPGDYTISGLAIDPLAQTGSGIDQVSFYLGPRDQGGQPLGTVTPSGGPHQSDFSLAIQLPSASPGTQQQLVGYAHSQMSDKTTELSLPIVLGGTDPHPVLANPFLNANIVNTNPGTIPDNCAGSVAVTVPDVLTGGSPGTAQMTSTNDLFGTVVGAVTTCTNGAEQPASLVIVQADGTRASVQTDEDGAFALTEIPAPGTYTISVTNSGSTATRLYVPVAPGETIDIGTLELGAQATGCGDEDNHQGP